ncbi:hypothetical protein G6F62_009631 [Rhizopus arrhizus]|nr:hypothetical protein G6F62_009631 [Rhizopus arrhizus]
MGEMKEDEDELELIGSGPRGAFRWLKGRRFLNHTSQSILPNDQIELDRARVQAFILRWVFGGNTIASIHPLLEKGISVLNVGHGPGIWVGHHIIDLALDYRASYFAAVDVCDLLPDDFEQEPDRDLPEDTINHRRFTPIHPNLSVKLQTLATPALERASLSESVQSDSNIECGLDEDEMTEDSKSDCGTLPKKRHVLKNLDFYRVNVIDEKLPFEDGQFDFVKQRLVTASYTKEDWKRVMLELVRVTKPGGLIGLLEIDYKTCNLGPKGTQFEKEMLEITQQAGFEPRMATHLSDLLKAVGLEDVSTKLVSIPMGEWGLDLGVLWKNNLESFAESTSPLMSKMMNITVAEYMERWRVYMEEAKETKPFTNVYAVRGTKPLNDPPTVDWSLCPIFNK